METMTGVQYEKDTLGRTSPYNPEFVAKIRRAEKQPSVILDLDNLWNTKKPSQEYTDAEILVYNSMINASKIIAKHL
ncbi:hypothetical protein AGMMS4957_06830 [Bacteroidia bacterium]|nr:hypothetical protein AGMMS4957_06830 [Bacteroidia bacterium]